MLHDSPATLTFEDSSSSSSPLSSSVFACPNPLHPLHFTIDGWTGPDHESYICITVHCLDDLFMMHSAVLDIFLATDRHTGESIAEWMVQQLRGNDISASCFAFLA